MLSILRFELGFWFRGLMVYVFFFVFALLIFLATISDNLVVGGAIENTNRNAPYVVQNFYNICSIIGLLTTTAFASAAATRDFAYRSNQIVFATPIKKWNYLIGHFLGAFLASLFPLLGIGVGVFLGSVVARAFPSYDPEVWGPNSLWPHVGGFLAFVVPNTFLACSITFAIAATSRSSTVAFVGAILLLIGSSFSQVLVQDLENRNLAAMLDPFGGRAFADITQDFTAAERNSISVMPTGLFLANRIAWSAFGALVFAAAGAFFRFADITWFARRKRSAEAGAPPAITATTSGALAIQSDNRGVPVWRQALSQCMVDTKETIRSRVFLILVGVSFANLMAALSLGSGEGYGNNSFPVTYQVIENIQGGTYFLLVAIITFYAGVLVWKERESKLDEVYDALPYPTWVTFLSKSISLLLVVALFLVTFLLVGIVYQALNGYYRFQIGLYLSELFAIDFVEMACLCMLALLCQVLSPNKYVGYFSFVVLVVLNAFALLFFDWSSMLLAYGEIPEFVYSDFYGYAPFKTAYRWFATYWILVVLTLGVIATLLWPRGKEHRLVDRWQHAKVHATPRVKLLLGGLLLAVAGVGGWIYFNTAVQNELVSSDVIQDRQEEYETLYRKYIDLPQPRVTQVNYQIEIYPETRDLIFSAEQTIHNPHDQAIETVHFVLADFDTAIELPDSKLVTDDEELQYQIYELATPMEPGESRDMTFTVRTDQKGFTQTPENMQVNQNGTFFNNSIAPQIGYQQDREIQSRSERRARDLGEPHMMAELHEDCGLHCNSTYISNNSDWVDVTTVISTSSDQIAIAPGSLVREWEESGRRFFEYKLDHPSLNFYSFMSARYEIAREQLGDIDVEVYYHPEHSWNVPRMISSIRKSLEYYIENFGPYKHKQARIIEFPRVASFAQAFPGTMPYSESIGFIADLSDEDAVDTVYYVVAHEMAHQWWAHQVIGANVEGATVMSETLAQYSALMVMEQEYGRDMMRKFLQYEMDNYLRGRGRDPIKERPLGRVEASQGYIHYRKGSVVLYNLKELVGEETINAALRAMVDLFAYQGPPYPTSNDFVTVLRNHIDEQYHPVINDMFERIVLYDNEVKDVAAKKLDNGKYEVTLNFETSKYESDADGNRTTLKMKDYIEIGAFAAPETGKKYGRTLHRERLILSEGSHTATFVTDELPDQVGVDPFLLLIDRDLDDNLKRPSL